MDFLNSPTYKNGVEEALSGVELSALFHKTILITGASGLLGSGLTDMLRFLNRTRDSDIQILACGRSRDRLLGRFGPETAHLRYLCFSMGEEPGLPVPVDYMIHAAGNSYPAVIANDPTGTLLYGIEGIKSLLDRGMKHRLRRFLYVSSGEVYGKGDLSMEAFPEGYAGFVDPLDPRSCYPMGKRAAETLCVSYHSQYGVSTVIARPSHLYGPNTLPQDNHAVALFLHQAAKGEPITLKSAGKALRSYTHVFDCALALLHLLIHGEEGRAYNIANPDSALTIAELAGIIAKKAGVPLCFEDPDAIERAQFSPIEKQVLDASLLLSTGFSPSIPVEAGIEASIQILKELNSW